MSINKDFKQENIFKKKAFQKGILYLLLYHLKNYIINKYYY
jgi:hypothetical protein